MFLLSYSASLMSFSSLQSTFLENLSKNFVNLTIFILQFCKKAFSFGSNCLRKQTEKRYQRNICVFQPIFTKVYIICKKFGNKLFSCFDIFIYVSSNFTLNSRMTKYLQVHIGQLLHTNFINFDVVELKKLRKLRKRNFSSNPCFLNLSCWERYNQPHIKYSFKQFV